MTGSPVLQLLKNSPDELSEAETGGPPWDEIPEPGNAV